MPPAAGAGPAKAKAEPTAKAKRGHPPVVLAADPGADPVDDLAKYCAMLDAAAEQDRISVASAQQYKNQLKRLTETVGRTVAWILGSSCTICRGRRDVP